jgi:hypothetical protein
LKTKIFYCTLKNAVPCYNAGGVAVNLEVVGLVPGANLTIASYNASVVNFCNATGSLARFENKNIFFYFEKRCILLQRRRCSCKFKSRKIGSSFDWPDEFRI